jgi:hypothetical protein
MPLIGGLNNGAKTICKPAGADKTVPGEGVGSRERRERGSALQGI